MPKRRKPNLDAPLQTINASSYITGESRDALRRGCKEGRIPHVRRGDGTNATYLINLPLYLQMLDEESRANLRSEARA